MFCDLCKCYCEGTIPRDQQTWGERCLVKARGPYRPGRLAVTSGRGSPHWLEEEGQSTREGDRQGNVQGSVAGGAGPERKLLEAKLPQHAERKDLRITKAQLTVRAGNRAQQNWDGVRGYRGTRREGTATLSHQFLCLYFHDVETGHRHWLGGSGGERGSRRRISRRKGPW